MSRFSTRLRTAVATTFVSIILAATSCALAASAVDEVRTSLAGLNRWLDAHDTGPGWKKFLHTDELEGQLADADSADPRIVNAILRQYAKGAPETDRPNFLQVRRALEAWLAELPPPPLEELPAAVEGAKEVFVPRTEADLTQARANLVEALARLDARLSPDDPETAKWKEYLQWEPLQEQLALEEGPDLRVLDGVYSKYAAGHRGLEFTCFTDVRSALRGYLTTARAIVDEDIESKYQQTLDALVQYLEAYRAEPTVEGAAGLSFVVQWLQQAGQAPWLSAAIRQHFTRPNFFGRIAADVVGAGIEGPVDETGPVRDSILGASVRGTGHTVGRLHVELVPSDVRAEIHTVFRGVVNSDTVSYKGPAQVYSAGVTQIETRKPMLVTAEGFATLPATSKATTRSTIKSIRAGRGGVAQQAATRQTYEQKSQAERIGARHAEDRASRRADEQAAEMIADAQQSFTSKFREPLLERGLFPHRLDFSTAKDAVLMTGLQIGPYDLGAPGVPPAMPADAHLAAQVHESMINNMAEEAYGGAIVTEAEFRASLEEFLGEVPEQFEAEEDREPWKITFARNQPMTVRFADGELHITIRGHSYSSGDSSYPGMDVTAVYKIVEGDEGLKAVRQGELAVFPPNFKPGSGKRLAVRQQTIRRMLERRFGKIFEEEMVPEPLELPGRWADSGKYGLDQWETADGWMVMAWNRLPGSEAAEEETSD